MLAYKQNIFPFPQRQPEITVHKFQAAPITALAADANPDIPLNEAPPEAWRQAIVPDLYAAAAYHAEPSSSLFRAIVVLCLLHLKSKAGLAGCIVSPASAPASFRCSFTGRAPAESFCEMIPLAASPIFQTNSLLR